MKLEKKEVVKYLVDNSGDYDVGLNGFAFEVSVSEKGDFFGDAETLESFNEVMKEKLKEFCEAYDGKTYVMTEKEFDSMVNNEVAKAESLAEGE